MYMQGMYMDWEKPNLLKKFTHLATTLSACYFVTLSSLFPFFIFLIFHFTIPLHHLLQILLALDLSSINYYFN